MGAVDNERIYKTNTTEYVRSRNSDTGLEGKGSKW